MTIMTTPAKPAESRKRLWVIVGASVLALACVAWGVSSLMGGGPPRLNDSTVALTKFYHSDAFVELPHEQQVQYLKVLDDRDKEIDQTFAEGKLSEAEYRSGLEASWLGKHVNRVEKYFALPPGQARGAYLDKLLDKREEKKADDKKSKAASNDRKLKADETAAELRVERWPADARMKWDTFHNAYRDQRKARDRDDAAKPAPNNKTP
jgi:hypothetical protein